MNRTAPIVLASQSASRRAMLEAAGIAFAVDPAAVDEAAVKDRLKERRAEAREVAETLAWLKAEEVSRRHGDALVVGSDQMLVCNGRWFDKPESRAGARAQLLALKGRRHELIAAVTVVRNGEKLWHHVERAALTMRAFSEDFLDGYLDRVGSKAFQSVGAYQIEGLGVQLFENIEGDSFTIMGMPLLPLLAFLRGVGALPS
ncbi:MAG TPA: Maf family nucleotide pyrophosphatase [Alphaproteobacteria bacterium]|nr:Maf family nucleotide pyrophosphatase [Alphaproteobacteria bacterium]